MFAFQLIQSTLDLAQALNNGVRPANPRHETEIIYFVYLGEDEVPEIITYTEFKSRFGYDAKKAKQIWLHDLK